MMMNRLSAFLIVLVSGIVHAESYLCVAEAGAAVVHGGGEPIVARIADVSNQKFVVTNDSGKWLVKSLGQDEAVFDKCVSPYFCQRSDLYAGTFNRYENGVFSFTWFPPTDKQGHEFLAVAKGRCSKL